MGSQFIHNKKEMKEIVSFLKGMVYSMEGKHMKKKKSEALLQRLIENKISREEFEELLRGLEDTEMAGFLEESMRAHFDKLMNAYEEENQNEDAEKSIEKRKEITQSNQQK